MRGLPEPACGPNTRKSPHLRAPEQRVIGDEVTVLDAEVALRFDGAASGAARCRGQIPVEDGGMHEPVEQPQGLVVDETSGPLPSGSRAAGDGLWRRTRPSLQNVRVAVATAPPPGSGRKAGRYGLSACCRGRTVRPDRPFAGKPCILHWSWKLSASN